MALELDSLNYLFSGCFFSVDGISIKSTCTRIMIFLSTEKLQMK